MNRPRVVVLDDYEDSLRKTTFHRFDDQAAAARRPAAPTDLHFAPPALSPPSRPTDVEHRLETPKTDLEEALVPTGPKGAGRKWLMALGLLLLAFGSGTVVAWWVTRG